MYYFRSLFQGKHAELLSSLTLQLNTSFTEVKRRLRAEGKYSVARVADNKELGKLSATEFFLHFHRLVKGYWRKQKQEMNVIWP